MPKSPVALIVILVIGALMALANFVVKQIKYGNESVPPAISISTFESEQRTQQALKGSTSTQQAFPPELNFAMTFYPQAPFGNWDEPWQNACEETSILLVMNLYYHDNWTRDQFNTEILKLVAWENKTFGDYKDTNALQMVKMLKDFAGLTAVILKNPSFTDVQKALTQGHLVLMPFAGREIGNPFYTNGGPDYHVMVIKGYKTGEKVITEDVGTQHGENYVYPWKTLQKANHDYTLPIDNGAKLMIEVSPPSNGF